MTGSIDRRAVLGGAAAAGAAGLAGEALAAQAGRTYRVGVVGAGWFGKLNLHALMAVAPVEVVALCDVDSAMLADARAQAYGRTDTVRRQTRRPAIYRDYREMLRRHRFDIVIVATPDHWHALPAIAAMKSGANVYVEKPISVDVAEGQAMIAAARANNVVVQAGTQRRTSSFLIEARERVVQAGLLGKVGHIEVFCYFHQRPAQFPPNSAPPANLDWDLYCGPAPLIDFNPSMHPRDWRSFEGFGNGYLGDVGVHFIDAARHVMRLGWPKRISSSGGALVDTQSIATVPDTQSATFEYDDLMMTWTNRHWGRAPNPQRPWGAAIHGQNGTLWLYDTSYEWRPREGEGFSGELTLERLPQVVDGEAWERPLVSITRTHMRDFLAAIEAGTRPTADVEDVHVSTSMCALANMSLKLGRPLAWDAATQTIVGDAEANAMLARPYRAPWTHPAA